MEWTYQDWEKSDDRDSLVIKAIDQYRHSDLFYRALEAADYFCGRNHAIAGKTILQAQKVEGRDENGRRRFRAATKDVVGNRIGSSFLFRFVTQQNQFLLSNGCILEKQEHKDRLGIDFDRVLAMMGEKALISGVCWGYWNVDHVEMLEAAKDLHSGFFVLEDEETGEARVGIQFWQLPGKDMYVRLFEEDGVSVWQVAKNQLAEVHKKQAYLVTRRTDLLSHETVTERNWGKLPIIPLYANVERQSELTQAIKAKIDAYDVILSDFADNLERANDVYWVLNNFGGTSDDIALMLEEIRRIKAVANLSDGSGNDSSAEPKTIEVPYAARQTALEILEKALYQDYMALNLNEVTGGSLTNVAIQAAMMNLHLKADRYEWQVFDFVQKLLRLLGIRTENIRFQRQVLVNRSEVVQDIAAMRQDIDLRTALKLNPYIQPEEMEAIARKVEG